MNEKILKAYHPYSLLNNFELYCYDEFRDIIYLWILYKPLKKIFKFTLTLT